MGRKPVKKILEADIHDLDNTLLAYVVKLIDEQGYGASIAMILAVYHFGKQNNIDVQKIFQYIDQKTTELHWEDTIVDEIVGSFYQ